MMASFQGECSIMKEISKAEEVIKTCYERVNILEEKLHLDSIAESKKHGIRTELAEVRKLLLTNEQQLSQLHKYNRKTFVFAAALCFVLFTVYALYLLVQGKDF